MVQICTEQSFKLGHLLFLFSAGQLQGLHKEVRGVLSDNTVSARVAGVDQFGGEDTKMHAFPALPGHILGDTFQVDQFYGE